MTQPHPPIPVPPAAPELRISTVIGDRLCIKCAFNLAGQPVVRESIYGMAIVRCPECSTVASLQEYPLLGRWAGRFAAALAGIWLLLLIGGIFATAGPLFGMTQGNLETGSTRLANHISNKHKEWYDNASQSDRVSLARAYGGQTVPTGPDVWVDIAWWDRQKPESLIADLGGINRAIGAGITQTLFWTSFLALVLGAVWSVFLLHTRRWHLMIFAFVPLALALLFSYLASTSSMRIAWGGAGIVSALHKAQSILWPWIVTISLTASYLCLCIGAWIGRPLIRLLARLLLPPRMLGSLAYLWIAEGKPPPRPASPKRS